MTKAYYVFRDEQKFCNGGFFDVNDVIQCAEDWDQKQLVVLMMYLPIIYQMSTDIACLSS